MFKKSFKIVGIILILGLLFSFSLVKAENNNNLDIYFFTGEGCPHCAAMKEFLLNDINNNYPEVKFHEFEVYKNRDNALLLKEAAEMLGAQVSGVPFLVIGDQTFVGYSPTMSPDIIKERINYCLSESCTDSLNDILITEPEKIDNPREVIEDTNEVENNSNSVEISQPGIINENLENNDNSKEVVENITEEKINDDKNIINIPVLGEIDAKSFSLPVLTVVMGILDGFNPCAMWVLLFLISLLLNVKDKKRMWILGSTFIVASAFVYFMFMAAWLNLIMFLGLIIWVRILIGLLALGGGTYSLRDFFVNKEAACKVSGGEKRQRTFDKLKKAVHQKNLFLALIGIIVLAFAVNLVELFCSAGLPAVYTQVLALNDISNLGKYLYILLYILFFMIDDLIIFFIAMTTLHITGISTKYSRLSRLIGGILMLAIGLMLIFRPEWLMFG